MPEQNLFQLKSCPAANVRCADKLLFPTAVTLFVVLANAPGVLEKQKTGPSIESATSAKLLVPGKLACLAVKTAELTLSAKINKSTTGVERFVRME